MNVSWESEKEMEDWLFDNETGKQVLKDAIQKVFFRSYPDKCIRIKKSFRQFNLLDFGIADILVTGVFDCNDGMDSSFCCVVELKNTELKPEHIAQASRYLSGVENAELFDHSMALIITTNDCPPNNSAYMRKFLSNQIFTSEIEINPSSGASIEVDEKLGAIPNRFDKDHFKNTIADFFYAPRESGGNNG